MPMLAADFARDGFLGPIRLFTPAECRAIIGYLRSSARPAPSTWFKGRAVHDRFLYEIATRPTILEQLGCILGSDVVLWGASDVRRRPGQVHPWHSDIESCAPEGGFVSVWIGIENTTRESALQVIRGSHLIKRSVQEARASAGLSREGASPEALLELVRREQPDASLIAPSMEDGEAIFFDGRIWHGTDNRNPNGERVALLLQYAAADRPVRIPDFRQLDWPVRYVVEPRPPVVVVCGSDRAGPNRVVPPPPRSAREKPVVETAIHTFSLPLGVGETGKPWQAFPAFDGPTRTLSQLACHASVLASGHTPHPPHSHVEEELLVPLHGEVELVIPKSPSDEHPRTERLTPGSFAYYPAWQHHTIRNPGEEPVAYLMFKWKAPVRATPGSLGVELIRFGDASPPEDREPFWHSRVLEGPTGILGKLQAHVSVLAPGAGYEPHRDAYDVAIVTISGTVETLGHAVPAGSVVYYSAGELHGMRNPGSEPARYLVFEFHAPGTDFGPERSRRKGPIAAIVRSCKRLARPITSRVRRFRARRD